MADVSRETAEALGKRQGCLGGYEAHMSSATMPTIFEFVDYRKYLEKVFAALKQQHPGFSYRAFAKLAGSSAPNFLQFVLARRLSLNYSSITKLAQSLKLKKAEEAYLESMVAFDHAKSHEERDKYFRRLLKLKRKFSATKVEAGQYEYYSKWYYSAVRAVLGYRKLRESEADLRKLARELAPPISLNQARKAVSLLLDLGLIRTDENDYLVQAQPVITTGEEVRSLQVASFQIETMRLAVKALESCPARSREMSTLTLNISARGFREIRERIRSLRAELMEIAKRDANDDRVYQLNVQLFPLSKVD